MDPKKLGWCIGLGAALLITWLIMRPSPVVVSPVVELQPVAETQHPPKASPPTPTPTEPLQPFPVNPVAAKLNDPTLTAKDDVANVHQLLVQLFGVWKSNLRPMSLNREFTRALTGDNPMRLPFVTPDHPAIINGELTDRWGQPYQFHILSMDRIEVRSAGPDGQFYSEDDALFSPWNKQPPINAPAGNAAADN